MCTCKAIYLAAPLSTEIPELLDYRLKFARAFALDKIREGKLIISSLLYTFSTKCSPDFWLQLAKQLVPISSEIWVLKLPGWEHSFGVKLELQEADKFSIPIKYLECPTDYGNPATPLFINCFGSHIRTWFTSNFINKEPAQAIKQLPAIEEL